MGIFAMGVLWASGLLAGLEASHWHAHSPGLRAADLQRGMAVALLAAGAVLSTPWSAWVWVAATVLTLGLPGAQRPGNTAWLPAGLPLLLLLPGLFLPSPEMHASLAAALLLAAPLAGLLTWKGPAREQPVVLALFALLAFLAVLAALLMLTSGQLQMWLVQMLAASTIVALPVFGRRRPVTAGGTLSEATLQQAVRQERERIYQNLHDDIGSRLLSLIHRASTPEEADFARCLLQDLRDAVARTVQLRLTLRDLLADQRAETEQRLQGLDLALIWPAPDSVPDQPLSPTAVAALKRSLRELFSNIIRHADASRVVLECTCDGRKLDLYLQDDGRGLPEPHGEGRGMSGIRRRMQSLGGTVAWLPAMGGGTRVHLQLPLARAG